MYERERIPDRFEPIEIQLRQSMRPVQPREAFVGHLQKRLVTRPAMTVERKNSALALLLVALSFASGLLLLVGLRHFRDTGDASA